MLAEKLSSGIKETERLYEFANFAGKDVIKLVFSSQRLPIAEIVGFQVPVSMGNIDVNSIIDGVDVKFDIGSLYFYPDTSGILWGYLIDTEENRKRLAKCLHKHWFRIVDTKVRESIAELALSFGCDIDKKAGTTNFKYSPREAEAIEKLKKTEEELAQMRKDMATIMMQLSEKKEQPANTDVGFEPPVDEKVDGRKRRVM